MEVKNDLIVFNHKEFGELKAIEINGEPWFIGKDVAEKLGYKDSGKAVRTHVDLEDKKILDFKGFGRFGLSLWNGNDYSDKTLINESGVYSLIIGSKLESAKRFKRWITSEVLPSLRKYGSYSIVKPDSYMIDDEIERAKRWIEEAEERKRLALTVKEQTETIRQQEPLVDFAKTVSGSEDCIDVMVMAKLETTTIFVNSNY